MVNFAHTFSPDKPCEAVHTAKRRQIFLEPEQGIWMVLVSGMVLVQPHSLNNESVCVCVLNVGGASLLRMVCGSYVSC